MFLKKLEIHGFKSFAEKTILDFEAKGDNSKITGIVGPNGSGKSNVVDAIRWVLGEQSYKLMRSKKSEDVVFYGSAKRQRGGAASVSIILDNSEGAVPLEFQEIIITRKVYGSGESEYLINNSKVRLIDIHELLSKCGFGQTTYTVIGQGMVDQMLFYGPTERKVLFDEAAGVKKYQIKRDQAVRKLEGADKNIIRLKDIMVELSPRVENLKRLVKRAEGRKEFEEEVSSLQNYFYSSLLFDLTGKKTDIEERKSGCLKKVTILEREIESIKESIEKGEKIPFLEEKNQIEERLVELSKERDSLLQEVSFLSGQLNHIKENHSLKNRDRKDPEEENIKLKEKIPFLEKTILKTKEEISSLEDDAKVFKEEISVLDARIESLNAEIKSVNEKDEEDGLGKIKKDLKEKVEQKEIVLEKIEVFRRHLTSDQYEKRRDEERIGEARSTLEQTKISLKILNDKSIVLRKEKEEKEKILKTLEIKISGIQEQIEKHEKELHLVFEKQGQQSLAELKKEAESLFEESVLNGIGEQQDLNKVKDKIVAFSVNLLKFGKKIKEFLNAHDLTEREKSEKILADLRLTKRQLEEELRRLGADLSLSEGGLKLLEDRAKEKKENISRFSEELKTLENKTYAVTGGKELTNLLKNKEELEKGIQRIEEIYENSSKLAVDQQTQILIKKAEVQNKLSDCKAELHQKEVALYQKRHILDNQERELRVSNDSLEKIKERLLNISDSEEFADSGMEKDLKKKKEELEDANLKISRLKEELSKIVLKEQDFSGEIFAKERELREKNDHLISLGRDISSIEIDEAKNSVRKEDLDDEIARLNIAFKSIEVKETLEEDEKEKTRSKIELLKRRLESIGDVDLETQEEYGELSKRHGDISLQVEDLDQARNDLHKIVRELDLKIKEQFGGSFKNIATEFNRYFRLLFDGGEANLSLERSDDPDFAEATTGREDRKDFGIEITACPPGKKVKNLSVLSGGERTLTSLALLFAILSVNPSPFVVLDEVDAALDEENTKRFLKIIEDLSKKTQFIIITHNGETMRIADSIYGVTMDDQHISKLLSLRISEIEVK